MLRFFLLLSWQPPFLSGIDRFDIIVVPQANMKLRAYPLFASYGLRKLWSYRMATIAWILEDILNVFFFPFLWLSVFAISGTPDGFGEQSIITYYIALAIVSVLVSSNISYDIAEQIRGGQLGPQLTRPFSYLLMNAVFDLGYSILALTVVMIPLILIFIFSSHSIPVFSVTQIVLFGLSLVLARVLTCYIEILTGLIAFWTVRVWGVRQLLWLLNQFFGGRMVPLPLLPKSVVTVLPFFPQSIQYALPALILTGILDTKGTFIQLGIGIVWAVILGSLTIHLWRKGLLRYDGDKM